MNTNTNKAAEEGGLLEALQKIAAIEDQMVGADGEEIEEAREIANQAIEAYLASRQVANKAEVEQLRHEHKCMVDAIRDAAVKAGICREDACLTGPHLLMLCDDMASVINRATPPATTGASTAGLESILDMLEDAIGGYSGGPFDKVQVIIDELRAVPDCGACPGDGSMCKSRCKVEEESPASTVLTDERIWDIWKEGPVPGGTVRDMLIRHTRAVLREVAAQAGQVAVPDDVAFDAARWRFMMRVADDADGLEAQAMESLGNEQMETERPESEQMCELVDQAIAKVAAPSPAKESK